jgi:hypothetical protein
MGGPGVINGIFGKTHGGKAAGIYVQKDIPIKVNNKQYYIQKGTRVTNAESFAKGREIREVGRLIKDYVPQNGKLTKAADWSKMKGTAVLIGGKSPRAAEVHWYQGKNYGKAEWKWKHWIETRT